MRFGVLLLPAQFPGRTHTRVLDATVAAAVTADEDAGFEHVWIAEHHFMSYGVCPSAITLAGYLLGATRRIAVGTAVSVLTVQHPIALPEQALLTRSRVAGPPRRRSRRPVDRPPGLRHRARPLRQRSARDPRPAARRAPWWAGTRG